MNDTIPKTILRATGIKKSFFSPTEVTLLRGVDLTVSQGDTVAIMGRSGEGKSTLLHILGTLEKPCAGTLEIAGQDVAHCSTTKLRNQRLAFIFQSFHLLEDYTAIENILMPARIGRRDTSKGSAAYKNAYELLDIVGLSNRADFHTKLLSGGEKQRVAIARALCNDPEIIFADEPTGNLDRHTSSAIQSLLLGFAKDRNKSLVIVTHDQDLANLCGYRYRLVEGLLVKG